MWWAKPDEDSSEGKGWSALEVMEDELQVVYPLWHNAFCPVTCIWRDETSELSDEVKGAIDSGPIQVQKKWLYIGFWTPP